MQVLDWVFEKGERNVLKMAGFCAGFFCRNRTFSGYRGSFNKRSLAIKTFSPPMIYRGALNCLDDFDDERGSANRTSFRDFRRYNAADFCCGGSGRDDHAPFFVFNFHFRSPPVVQIAAGNTVFFSPIVDLPCPFVDGRPVHRNHLLLTLYQQNIVLSTSTKLCFASLFLYYNHIYMQDKDKKSTETEILEYWQKNKIFEQTLAKTKKGKPFVFYEGPPTANGKPGIHHVEGRSFKDVILRYKTMRGFRVPRVAGWDTHGLPVEVEVEKELGLKSKKEIEEYGIEAFNKKCRESVWKYKKLWEDMTARMGFWIDMDKPYVTYENSYMEKLWGVIKNFSVRKLLYKDYKVVPWCPRCGTSLSSHELAQGYKKIKEKSIYIKFKAKDKAGGVFYFLVWTTTPWTLPGNVALAVNPKATYVVAEKDGARFVLVKERAVVLGENYKVISERLGRDLIGVEYEPLYPHEN